MTRVALAGSRFSLLVCFACIACLGCDAPGPAPVAAIEETALGGVQETAQETTHETAHETPYGVAPDGSHFRYTSLAKLKVLELVVGGASPDDRLPLVVMLHGLADKPRLPGASAKHPRRPARVILPRGPYVFEQGFAWYPHRTRERKHAAMHVALEGTAQHLALLLRELEARHPAPCKPLLVGFSQGGMAALSAAIARPEAMSAAIAVASWIPPTLIPERRPDPGVPIHMMHGLADPIVPPEPAIELARELERRGYDLELQLFEGAAHAMTREMDAALGALIDTALERCGPWPPASEI